VRCLEPRIAERKAQVDVRIVPRKAAVPHDPDSLQVFINLVK